MGGASGEAVLDARRVVAPAEQRAPGEAREPAAWLEGDREAIYEAATLLDVDLDRDDYERLFRLYSAAEVA